MDFKSKHIEGYVYMNADFRCDDRDKPKIRDRKRGHIFLSPLLSDGFGLLNTHSHAHSNYIKNELSLFIEFS